MAKTRELPCIHYVCANQCDLGKEAEFYGLCQTCKSYSAFTWLYFNYINTIFFGDCF